MKTRFSYLEQQDIPKLYEFSKECKSNIPALFEWIFTTLDKDPSNIVVALEWEDQQIVGFSCSGSISSLLELSHSFLPIYINVRMERLPGKRINSFSQFINITSCMISSFFEKKNYFQYYVIRRLPKKFITLSDISNFCDRAWKSYPYKTLVEYIVKTEEEFNALPKFFKKINGPFSGPIVILSGVLDNNTREKRKALTLS